jgi:predicted lactoylglutathione lyase
LLLIILLYNIDTPDIVKKSNYSFSTQTVFFRLLDSVFFKITKDSASSVVFYSHFFRKCKEKKMFDILVSHIAQVAHSAHRLNDMRALVEHAMDLGLHDTRRREDLMHLWNETFEDLDKKTKKLVLFQMKLNTERRLEDTKAYLTREYEEMRFENRNEYERIVVEGKCKKCGVGPVGLTYLEYRKTFAHVGFGEPVLLDCPTCDTVNGLSISGT